MALHWMQWARLVVFPAVFLMSVIVLGVAADTITISNKWLGVYFTYDAFAVAVSVLTWSIAALFAIDMLRRGAFTSMIVVELGWLGLLWVLWLASAALSSQSLGAFGYSCDSRFAPDWLSLGCTETQAVVAFSWLIWIALSGYLVSLLTLSIIAHTKGSPIWTSSVRDATFTPVNVDLGGAMGTPASEYKAPQPHMQQQQQPVLNQSYPPQQHPGSPVV